MAENVNHHFVPQFYFRLFNDGRQDISVLLTKDGKIISHAPIKGQCARHMFYGNREIEAIIAGLEVQYSQALRALVESVLTGDRNRWRSEYFPWLIQALVFQRARTQLEVDKVNPVLEAQFQHIFREWILNTQSPADIEKIIGPLDRGEVRIQRNETKTLMLQLRSALENAGLLIDMQLRVIRNKTDYPFIFSDSPVVFYNSYLRNIKVRGVLGYQSPGLQIFLPLTPTLQLMMFDGQVYKGTCSVGPFCDIIERADVSQLNALQLHHSRNAIYFARSEHADYVGQLFAAHRFRLSKPKSVFQVRNDLQVNGDPTAGPILHTYEEQLAHELTLSFVEYVPVTANAYAFQYRSPELVKEHKKLNAEQKQSDNPMC